MIECVYPSCNVRTFPGEAQTEVSLFSFPKDPDRRKLWIDILELEENFVPKQRQCVCSHHFLPSCFGGIKQKKLRPGSLPVSKHSSLLSPEKRNFDQIQLEHSYFVSRTAAELTKMNQNLSEKLEDRQRKLTLSRKECRSLRAKVRKLEQKNRDVQKELDDKKQRLPISSPAKEIVQRIYQKEDHERVPRCSPELIQFSLTMQHYSTRGYTHLRKALGSVLPAPRTIQRWYSVLDVLPGISSVAMSLLTERSEKAIASGSELNVVLSMDEMAIKKGMSWDGKRTWGQVDFGDGINDPNAPMAKEVLVFLVAAVDMSFKIPVGFYFIDSLKGEEKSELVRRTIESLREINIRTFGLTCDGPPANRKMLNMLGGDLESGNGSFL